MGTQMFRPKGAIHITPMAPLWELIATERIKNRNAPNIWGISVNNAKLITDYFWLLCSM